MRGRGRAPGGRHSMGVLMGGLSRRCFWNRVTLLVEDNSREAVDQRIGRD